MGRIVQSFAMGFVRGCFARLLVGVYMAVVFGACFLLPLAHASRTPGADPKELFLPFGIGGLFILVLPAGLAFFATRARNARLDALFALLGLAGGGVLLGQRSSDRAPSPAPTVAGVRSAPAADGSGLLAPCPTAFENAGPMAVGESRSCVCLHLGLSGTLRGSGRYSAGSWICDAAQHAGVLKKAGDVVTFTRQADCPRLWGSRANDRLAINHGGPTATYSFTTEPPPCPPSPGDAAGLGPCPASGANGVDARPEGSSFDCTCRYNGMTNGRLMPGNRGVAWGTNVYASFSNVCDAAQHAGAVDFRGSTVTVFVGGTCDRFFGSKRFGIGSESWRKPARGIAFQQPFPACPTGPW